MSFTPPVSLVIVSRDRPAGLKRLVSALRFQSYRPFEVVVVSNYSNPAFLQGLPGAEAIRHVFFDEPNISKARNLGIAQAAGDFVAFCDDDAVPEVFWLERLIAPFENQSVASTGGYVRGRNGIDFQWTALKCDVAGDDFPLRMDTSDPRTFGFEDGFFAKVQGTNCAFRKSALLDIGGFDENYRFFLDETDVSIRLAKAGWLTTIIPLAEVQHGFEESAERTRFRVPKTLENIGASKRHFLNKHGARNAEASIEMLRKAQENRLLRLMQSGLIEPRQLRALMATLENGLARMPRQQEKPQIGCKAGDAFLRFLSGEQPVSPEFIALAGNVILVRKLGRMAMAQAMRYKAVTVFRYTHTALFHKRFFDARGFWVQTGGLFGKSRRYDSLLQFHTTKSRTETEMAMFAPQRPFGKLITSHFI